MRRLLPILLLAACDPAPAVGEVVTVGEAAARVAEGLCACGATEDWVQAACVEAFYGRVCDGRDCTTPFDAVRDLGLCEDALWAADACDGGVPPECVPVLLGLVAR